MAETELEETPEPAPAAPAIELPETPLFGKWSTSEVTIRDVGLQRYISLESVGLPHHSARHANRRFGKLKTPIVERFINVVMRSEAYQGKKSKAYQVVEQAFDRIHHRAKENPVQVLIKAIEHTAPREEVTRLRYGGINVPKAVDVSPQRRLDIALRNLAKGGVQGSFKSKKPASHCVGDEILKAASRDAASYAVGKRDEVERVAKSAR